jgi:hypothetical protein
MSSNTSSGMHRVPKPIKVAALVAVLGLVMLAIESPRLITGTGDVIAKASPPQTSQESNAMPFPTSASEYFPAQFPAPKGDAEAQPPTF